MKVEEKCCYCIPREQRSININAKKSLQHSLSEHRVTCSPFPAKTDDTRMPKNPQRRILKDIIFKHRALSAHQLFFLHSKLYPTISLPSMKQKYEFTTTAMAAALEETPVSYEDLAEIEKDFDDAETEISMSSRVAQKDFMLTWNHQSKPKQN